MSQPVCYGDIVYVDLDECLLFSNGFFDPSVHVVSKSNICLKSFRYGLFKIYPSFTYKDISQVDELKGTLSLLKSLNPDAERAYNEIAKDLSEEQKASEEREAKLDLLNEKIFNESKGNPVKYGQKIQLLHIQSQSFLVPCKTLNESDISMVNLSLSKTGSRSAYFTFKPMLAFLHHGEVVEYDTPLQIVSIKTETPIVKGVEMDLSTVKTQINDTSNVLTNNSDNFPVIWPRRKEPLFQQEKVYNAGLKSIENPDGIEIRKYLQCEDQAGMKKGKILKNGDSIRICNDQVYLTAYPGNPDLIYFQAYRAQQEYLYNNIYTLFQIVEVPEDIEHPKKDEKKEKVQVFNSAYLPRGRLLEYSEHKRYFLKHMVTGKMLVCEKGVLKLQAREDADKDIEKVSVVIKNKSKDHTEEIYLDKNAIMQVKFYGVQGEMEGVLSIGKGIKMLNINYDLNTKWFYGFEMTEDYLNKSLRTERFAARICSNADDKSSSFKFSKAPAEESAYINLGESLANHFAKFLDFLDDFLKKENHSLLVFNQEVKKLFKVCDSFEKQMYEEAHSNEQEVRTPNKLVQTLLREFRIYDMIYRLFFFMIKEESLLYKVKETIKKEDEELTPEYRALETISQHEAIKNKRDVNFSSLLKLFASLKKIIFVSFKKNPLNRTYCSQFVRIPITCLLDHDNGIFNLASFKYKTEMKQIMLTVCKKGLWDKDPDGLSQLNLYQDTLFEKIRNQETYTTTYLSLVKHISKSRAPNLDNKLRNSFLAEFLLDEKNLKHTFPSLQEVGNKVIVQYSRMKFPKNNFEIDLEELDEGLLASEIQENMEEDKVRMATTYLIGSLELMSALVRTNASSWNLMIVKHYKYKTLVKAIHVLKDPNKHRKIKLIMGEIINSVHQKFFALPYVNLPMKLQIINEDIGMVQVRSNITMFIEKAVDTSLSSSEMEYIRSQGIEDIIQPLKKVITSESNVGEVIKFITSDITVVNNFEEARTVLEEIEKVLETTNDIDLEFLKTAHQVVLKLIKETIGQKNTRNKTHYEFIKASLAVFTHIEQRMISYAATDIIQHLQSNNLLARKNNSDKEEDEKDDMKEDPSFDAAGFVMNVVSNYSSPRKSNKPVEEEGSEEVLYSGTIARLSKNWKLEKKLTIKEVEESKAVEDISKEFTGDDIINTLLDISLLNDQQLINGVIDHLRSISTYESMLSVEMNKFTIVYEPVTLRKVSEIIKATFRLNEISREVFFCTDNNLFLEEEKLDEIQNEIMDHLWTMFFAIYDSMHHFRYFQRGPTSKKRFKEAFLFSKQIQNDKYFKLDEDAIDRSFQKIFNILKVYQSLLKTLQWMMDPKYSSDQSLYAIRLILMILCAFLNKNRENQELFSGMNDFIHLYYVPRYHEQSPDTFILFTEMMRGNKDLLKLSMKHLYETCLSVFVGTLSKKIDNSESDGYLAAAISSYDFLIKCPIPKEVFNPIDTLEEKWQQISCVDEFSSLNLLTVSGNIIEVPHCYESIYQTIEATIKTLDHFKENSKAIAEIQLFLPLETWLGFFESKNYLLQYDLKNQITKCISKAYFEVGKKGKLVQKFEECSALFLCLIGDIIFFRKYRASKEDEDSHRLRKLTIHKNFITQHSQFLKLNSLYALAEEVELETKKLRLNFEQISLNNLFSEYIFGGCLDLLFHLALHEIDNFTEVIDTQPETRTLMDILLYLLDELEEFEGGKESFPHDKIEKFLTKITMKRGYGSFKDKIRSLGNKVYQQRRRQKTFQKTFFSQNEGGVDLTPLDGFNRHLDSLKKSQKELKEQNIKKVADHIAEHKDANDIIKQIINYLKKDVAKIDIEEVKFLLRLLRKYIEREHMAPGEETVDKWKEVNSTTVKKITKIQNLYKDLGLTEILYSYLTVRDDKFFKQTLLLSLAYLYGGNSDVQEEFFNKLTDDEDNEVIEVLSNELLFAWESFEAKEHERIHSLYGTVQKNLFEYLKENQSIEHLDEQQVQAAELDDDLDPKYKEQAESSSTNQTFMLVLTFLQALCEKQYTNMQTFLREQTWKGRTYPKSFDFLGFLRGCVSTYNKVLCKYNLAVGNKILALITELIQGNVAENIGDFLHKTFIYDMCRIVTDYNSRYHLLPRGFGLDPFHEDFRQIKSQVIFVFKTMLENKDENNIKVLTEHLDLMGLMKTFEQFIRNFLDKKGLSNKVSNINAFIFSLSNEDFKDTLGDAINIYIIYRYIWDDTVEFTDKMRGLIQGMDKGVQDLLGRIIFPLFKKLVASIEIMVDTKSNPLIRVWFPILSVCNYLHEDSQESFLENVKRDNIQTKISALTDIVQELSPQMYGEYSTRNNFVSFNLKGIYRGFRAMTNFFGIIIACVNIGTYKFADDQPVQDEYAAYAVKVMNSIQIFLALSLIAMWYFFFRKRHQTVTWERFVEHNVKALGPLPPTVKNKIDYGNYDKLDENDCRLIMMLEGPNSEAFREMSEYAPSFQMISRSYFILNLLFTLKSRKLTWHMIYFAITLLGVFHPFITNFEIFDIAIRSGTIKQVYAAVSKNTRQFLWTLVLLLSTNVIYTLIGFFFLNNFFVVDDDNDVLCETAFSCFFNVLNLGLRTVGGISTIIRPQPYSPDEVRPFVVRIIFDLSFFIIMIILLKNLIFGMIIDSYGELRDLKKKNEEDQNNICFMCGISRSEFERYASFDDHVANEHNVWSYVYYIIYILERKRTAKVEMTDIENFVLEKYENKHFDWFPIGKAITLERISKEEKFSNDNELTKLVKKVDTIQKTAAEDEAKLTAKFDQILNMMIED